MTRGRRTAGVRRLWSFVRSSYRRTMTVAFLLVFLFTSLAFLGLYVQTSGPLNDHVEQSMTAAANAEAGELSEWDERNRLLAQAVSEHPVFATGDPVAVRAYLRDQRETRDTATIRNVYVVDRRSQRIETSADPAVEGTSTTDLPWSERLAFRDFDDVRLIQPFLTPDDTPVIEYVTPIRQNPESLLVVTVETAGLFEQFEDPVQGGFTRVVNSNGTVVFADNSDVVLRQYQRDSDRSSAVSGGLRGESGFVDTSGARLSGVDQGGYVAAYAPINGTDWVVIKHVSEREAYAILHEVQGWIGASAALLLAGFLGIVATLSADIAGALSRLTTRAERIRTGEYDVEFETSRPDEFGELNRTFAAMQATLRERIAELNRAKADLERSNVALEERTEMISVLNRILRHNVRNDVNIIAANAELLSERIESADLREDLETVENTALELAAISEQTRRMQQLLGEENTRQQRVQLVERLEPSLERVSSMKPDATVSLHVDSEVPSTTSGVSTLPVAITDVVKQIITHNDGEVSVDVTVSTGEATAGEADDAVFVTIADDADGLPELDVQAVGRGEETPLKHAQGLSLWCLKWAVDKSGGELAVDTEDATVRIELRPAEG